MDKDQLKLSENTKDIQDDEPTKRRKTSSFIDGGEVLGRVGDRKAIIHSLFAIIGMGGWGKITLVQSIYGDEKVKEHFELTMWCV